MITKQVFLEDGIVIATGVSNVVSEGWTQVSDAIFDQILTYPTGRCRLVNNQVIAFTPAPRPPTVPVSVTRAQALMALYQAGILDELQTIIAAHPYPPVRIWFDNANEWRRDHPYIQVFGPELGLSDTDVDQLFLAASLLS